MQLIVFVVFKQPPIFYVSPSFGSSCKRQLVCKCDIMEDVLFYFAFVNADIHMCTMIYRDVYIKFMFIYFTPRDDILF